MRKSNPIHHRLRSAIRGLFNTDLKTRREGAANQREAVSEALESRVLFNTYTVTNTKDSGAGSLRTAMTAANNHLGADVINFAIGSGAKTIYPLSRLPGITDPVTINGFSQPGYSGKPLITINGSKAGSGVDGLRAGAGNSTIKGLVINRFSGTGIMILYKGYNTIAGNWIGLDSTGASAAPNAGHGILVQTDHNTIGGTTASTRNVISGNSTFGIFVYTSAAHHNTIAGNYVGTDSTGTKAVANLRCGIGCGGAGYNTIGGTAAGSRNVISGNKEDGILLAQSGSKMNVIQGNFVGTNAAGTARLGNGLYGIEISQPNNVVGGTSASMRNVLSGNKYAGIVLYQASGTGNRVQGNFVGTDYTGTKDLGNMTRGIEITNSANKNNVGGTTAGSRNVVSGNETGGIGIYNSSYGNAVQGNFIGLVASGTALLPNTGQSIILVNVGSNTISGNITTVIKSGSTVASAPTSSSASTSAADALKDQTAVLS